ncbi:MAG TPA: PilZ domain-containing protein [Pyrinomonadaceae bacterium]
MSRLIRLDPLGDDERRQWPRYLVPAEEPIVAGVALTDSDGRPRTLTGRVRDVSEAGLLLSLPTDESCAEFSERGRTLAVVLTLPSGVITLRARVAHCTAPDGRPGGGGYVVGVSIIEIREGDQDRLVEYIGERS